MTSPVKLYWFCLSPPARSVYKFASTVNIPLELIVIDLTKGEQNSESYLRVNPNHAVPAIDDNGFILWESHAILRYLADKFKVDDNWYPKDIQQRAKVDQWLDWKSALFFNVAKVFLPVVVKLFIHPDEKVNAENIEKATGHVKAILKLLNDQLADKKFLVGDSISIADIAITDVLQQFSTVDPLHYFLDDYENVKRWFNAVENSVPHWKEISAGINGLLEARKSQ